MGKLRFFVGDSNIEEENKGKDKDKEMLKELNNKSLRWCIYEITKYYNIDFQDLYPNNFNLKSIFPVKNEAFADFIVIRNKLFHEGVVKDYYKLNIESLRLSAIIERMLLRILSWNYLRFIPNASVLSQLQETNNYRKFL